MNDKLSLIKKEEKLMKIFSNSYDAIADLHNRGFTNDFHVSGNDLLLVQEKQTLKVGEFSILEYHRVREPIGAFDRCIVLGIVTLNHNVKGILLGRFESLSFMLPPVLIKKIKELEISSTDQPKS